MICRQVGVQVRRPRIPTAAVVRRTDELGDAGWCVCVGLITLHGHEHVVVDLELLWVGVGREEGEPNVVST